MKAKEWAVKITESRDKAFFDFAVETQKLINERSKGSKARTVVPVVEAVFTQQRQQWLAICRLCPLVTEADFDMIMESTFPGYKEYRELQNQIKMEKRFDKTAKVCYT